MAMKSWIKSLVSAVGLNGLYGSLIDPPFVYADLGTAGTVNPATHGLANVDGVAITAGQRIFLPYRSPGAEAGIYIASPAPWVRAADYNTDAQIRQKWVFARNWTGSSSGTSVLVRNTNESAITVGTTAITYSTTISSSGTRWRLGRSGLAGEQGIEFGVLGSGVVAASIIRDALTNGALTFTQNGTGIFSLLASGGIRLGNASAVPILDLRRGAATIAANTSVAAGSTQTVAVTVTGASTSTAAVVISSPRGVAIPTGLTKVGEWVSATNTVTVAFRNDTAGAISWPASATTIDALWVNLL